MFLMFAPSIYQIFSFFDLGGPLALGERKDHYLSIVIYTGSQGAYAPYFLLALNWAKNLVVFKVVKGRSLVPDRVGIEVNGHIIHFQSWLLLLLFWLLLCFFF